MFIPTWSSKTETITKLTKEGNDLNNGQQSISNSTDDRTLSGNAAFEYNRKFGSHNVSAMVLGNCYQQFLSGEYHAITNVNLGFDFSYNFDKRYYAQFSAAEPYSAKLAEGHRAVFSPTGTLGWRLSNESFMDGVSFIDNLLVSASAGVLNEDADVTSYYMYDGVWSGNGWGFTWNDGSNATSIGPSRGENIKLGMIKRKELTASVKASMFDKFVNLEFTYFTNKMSGYIIGDKSDWPNDHEKAKGAKTSYSDLFYTTKQSWKLPGSTEAIMRGLSGGVDQSGPNANNSNWNTSKVFGPKGGIVEHDNVIHQPTGNLVEMYGMENGLPIDDPESGFDPTHPFKNRDPRFYHDIVFDGFKYLIKAVSAEKQPYVHCELFTGGNMRSGNKLGEEPCNQRYG